MSISCSQIFQCLMDLENSRDDLLFELHKLPHQNPNDTRMLKEYFADVQKLSDDLGKSRECCYDRSETQNIVIILEMHFANAYKLR